MVARVGFAKFSVGSNFDERLVGMDDEFLECSWMFIDLWDDIRDGK